MTDVVGVDVWGASAVAAELEQHRVALTGYCYRMLGSAFEADDAVQETLVRAWRAADGFEGRSGLRTWLHRIATNVCFDMLDGRQRRARPMDLSSSAVAPNAAHDVRSDSTWIQPIPDSRALPAGVDPADAVVARESIRLAFVAALQLLPPRQRAVLILRDVLRWKADEVATLLDTTVASVNSALQRARATLAASNVGATDQSKPADDEQHALVDRFVDAFERYDIDALVTLLHRDVTLSMPPYSMWLQGPDEIHRWMLGPGAACRGSRLVPIEANASPAFAQYRPSGPHGRHEPWSVVILEAADGQVTGMNYFLDTETMFPLFGLPDHLDP